MKIQACALVAGVLLVASAIAGTPATAADAECPIEDTIVFGGLDYGSASFHTALARKILELGYGCETDVIPGTTLVLNQGLGRGDVDVVMEIWTANVAQVFLDAEAEGKVVRLGTTFPDAIEGWYVPRYVVEGDNAPAPNLKSVEQLADFKTLFEDPEDPKLGRFYNCVIGWQCEVVNSKKLIAYGLEDDYSNVRPGAGAALSAAVESAYLREKPVLFYHWAPTWLLGKYDFVKLEEPAYDKSIWDAMMASEDPDAATAYPQTRVVIGANSEFAEKSDVIKAFFDAYSTTSSQTSEALAFMHDNDASPEEAADAFLRTQPDVWSAWIPQDAATRVSNAIGK
ncbi:MAG: ABC transporter substrate-binding protein [Pseudomonadota bacterium]